MKIAVASEHRGFNVKDSVLTQIRELGHEAIDFGPATAEMCDYPDYAAKGAWAVSHRDADRAILIGGTGIGMCIVANKFQGVRAALCHDDLSAEMSRRHFDANVLCLSVDMMRNQVAPSLIVLWLTTPFEGGRHARRIAKLAEYERKIVPAFVESGRGIEIRATESCSSFGVPDPASSE